MTQRNVSENLSNNTGSCVQTGERSNRGNGGGGGYSHFRGANGSYRGGDRDGRDMRHGGGGGGNFSSGNYQGRAGANGPNPLQQSASSSATSPAPDFDLRAESSFPPLPGLEVGATSASATVSAGLFLLATLFWAGGTRAYFILILYILCSKKITVTVTNVLEWKPRAN